jgi:hypothetical protein
VDDIRDIEASLRAYYFLPVRPSIHSFIHVCMFVCISKQRRRKRKEEETYKRNERRTID